MAYTVIEVPKDTWTEIATATGDFQVQAIGKVRVYAYEGVTSPTEAPSRANMTQPFRIITSNGSDDNDFVDYGYINVATEKLYLYSPKQAIRVIKVA